MTRTKESKLLQRQLKENQDYRKTIKISGTLPVYCLQSIFASKSQFLSKN